MKLTHTKAPDPSPHFSHVPRSLPSGCVVMLSFGGKNLVGFCSLPAPRRCLWGCFTQELVVGFHQVPISWTKDFVLVPDPCDGMGFGGERQSLCPNTTHTTNTSVGGGKSGAPALTQVLFKASPLLWSPGGSRLPPSRYTQGML